METAVFEERFRKCREMPGADDAAYRSTANEMIKEAGGSISSADAKAFKKLGAAMADDQKRWWTGFGTSQMAARLAAFSDLYGDSDAQQRQILRDSFAGERLRELELFVARSARLLESPEDSQWLRRGLTAACLDAGRYDFRDLIASLSILRYGAERGGIEIAPFFREALEMIAPTDVPTGTPEVREILLTVQGYPQRELRWFVLKFGPPEWRDEVKPWWMFW
jgi:hypothetical protein